MRKFFLVAALVAMIASPATAAFVAAAHHGTGYDGGRANLHRTTGYYAGSGGEFTIKDVAGSPGSMILSNSAYSPLTKGVSGANSFQSFCIEDTENTSTDSELWVSTEKADESGLGTHAWHGSVAGVGDDLEATTARLYFRFATGFLPGYNYTAGPGRVSSANILQRVIWKLEGEIGSLGLAGADLTQANSWIALANAEVAAGACGNNLCGIQVIQVERDNGRGQDQLYLPMVPAPGAVLLGMIGLSTIGWIRRRRNSVI